MSENDNPQIPHKTEDHFLAFLVSFADKLELPITLSVGGMLISGITIPVSDYLRRFGDQLGSSFSELEYSQVIKDIFANISSSVESQEQGPEDHSLPVYIYLKQAKFFMAASPGIPTTDSVLWRGKISSVDGFSLGQLST